MTDLPANVDVTSILDSSQFPKEQPKEVSFKLNELRCDMAKLYGMSGISMKGTQHM